MSELKREYWSETLSCVTGKVKIDRREIVAIATPLNTATLEIHLKSGTIFTITNWDVNTIANLSLTHSPHEEVHTLPTFVRTKHGIFREGKAPESEE